MTHNMIYSKLWPR